MVLLIKIVISLIFIHIWQAGLKRFDVESGNLLDTFFNGVGGGARVSGWITLPLQALNRDLD
jgi:hypothetical protein